MSSKCKLQQIRNISFKVDAPLLDSFTTLLQSGIFLGCSQGESIGDLLENLPGFTEEYIGNRVQTIFLNGLPADDLDQQIFGEEATLAISAAMPGLAGAIFRKGGVHSSLRTASVETAAAATEEDFVLVRIKLFNMIARERGKELLGDTCRIMASSLAKFLAYRPPLFAGIIEAEADKEALDVQDIPDLLKDEKMIELTIRSRNGS